MKNDIKNELEQVGFVTDKLRRGVITTIIGVLIVSNFTLLGIVINLNGKIQDVQEKLYERVIDEMRPTVQKWNNVAEKVDGVATRVDSVAIKTSEAADQVQHITNSHNEKSTPSR
ncbi:MAG: hypothetical protein INR69_17405 [Mucilaginibacter polytrichastri]|nr:hypothetical protein [Mucilaginibacter polytrichastri]